MAATLSDMIYKGCFAPQFDKNFISYYNKFNFWWNAKSFYTQMDLPKPKLFIVRKTDRPLEKRKSLH